MKVSNRFRFIFIFLLSCAFQTKAQTGTLVFENSHYLYNHTTSPLTNLITPGNVTEGVPLSTGFSTDVAMPPEITVTRKKISDAVFLLKVNLGDDYIYGPASSTPNAPLDFKFKVTFSLTPLNGTNVVAGVLEQSNYELVIENNRPEAVFVKNFAQFNDIASNTVGGSDFSFQRFRIDNVKIVPLISAATAPSTQASMLAKIANSIRFEISYDINYGIDVTSISTQPVISSLSAVKQAAKQIVFNWDNAGAEFPNYEFELLRLYNIAEATSTSETHITTNIDWSKALRLETQSSETSMQLTIGEGTGFYVWRVRPIGTFFDGGIANSLNYSEAGWSVSPGNVSNTAIEFAEAGIIYGGTAPQAFFYYEDVAEDKNWIYSRKFSEGNKMSENLVYATPLQQVRQSQSYRVSQNTTLVTQTLQDFSGRATLSTVNVPVDGPLGDYKEKLVQKDGTTELYTAKDFDDATNANKPSKVNQNGTPFSYYSNQNSDLSIPDAEGYPFQRTTFYNDGSQRVKEQSGVGKTHMIGDGSASNGGGKTTRTFYGTPSKTELISLFGDEAPDHEAVLKTITVDPNNTASVSYTSKEGKVIATGLSFNDGEGSILDPLTGQPLPGDMQTVKDAITKNLSSEKGFVSSKRIALMQQTSLKIDYRVRCQELEDNCLDLALDCKYKVRIVIHNVDNPSATQILPEVDFGGTTIPCTPDAQNQEYKSYSWGTITLQPGTYVIEKIMATGDPAILVEGKTKAEKQIMPLVNRITTWLEDVDCEEELEAFYANLRSFATKVNAAATDPAAACNSACVVQEFGLGDFEITDKHLITLRSRNSKPVELEINSPCCNIVVNVEYFPPFRCPASYDQVDVNHNNVYDVNLNYLTKPEDTEYFPDLEGYGLSLLNDCIGTNGFTQAIFYSKYMIGWDQKGDFNKMVYHMLTDKYVSVGADHLNGTNPDPPAAPQVNDCGIATTDTGITCDPPGSNNCTQYTCAQVAECWSQQIGLLRNNLCGGAEYETEMPTNVSNRSDEEAGETPGSGQKHDNHFNDSFKDVKLKKRKRKKLKKKIAKAMRELSASPAAQQVAYQGVLVKDFLDCTGYKFAKILTKDDPYPLIQDRRTGVTYAVPFVNVKRQVVNPPNKKIPYCPPLVGTTTTKWHDKIVVPAVSGVPAKTLKDYYPNIKDPYYAFKYFEYPETARNPEVEASTCFADPNDCYQTDAAGNVKLSNGVPLKIPCCFMKNANGTYSETPLCQIDNAFTGSNGNYASNSSNPTNFDKKYYVKDFCDRGQLRCEYTKEGWSSGQRYTFYNMINQSFPQTVEEEGEGDPAEVCEDFTSTPTGIYNEDTNPLGLTPDEIEKWKQWNDISGSIGTFPTVVQFEMLSMTKNCEGRCDERKDEFKSRLQTAFVKNGYVIGGCKVSSNDNVVPVEDIDLLVAQIVAQCKVQCPVTTYKCAQTNCRELDTPTTQVGFSDSYVDVEYGVGGCGTAQYPCPANAPGCNDTQCDPSTGNCGNAAVLSRCQQKKWKQVMEWDFEIDMPSQLETAMGQRKFTCVSNPNMADYTVVPSLLDRNVPIDINNIKLTKTVSPAVEISLTRPAKN
jgi:hypothetical protein